MVETKYGKVEGIKKDGCTDYLGIPFAKAPVGDLMFRHPEEPDPWNGVLKADHGSKNPIQSDSILAYKNNDLDCLYMNIFVPDHEPGTKLPVMVWIYGGAFETGAAGDMGEAEPKLTYDFTLFARETKTIVVSFNYRVNIFGFMNLHFLDETCDYNNGLYDQLRALHFVQENIAAFDGDPDNVTLFGQSAGGGSVLTLMSMEESKGLFHKAIAQSPCVEFLYTEEESRKKTRLFMKKAKVKSVPEIAALPVDQLPKIIGRFSKSVLMKGELRCSCSPVIDGVAVKGTPATASGRSDIPLLIGTVKEEGNLFAKKAPGFVYPIAAKWIGMPMIKEEGTMQKRFSDSLTLHAFVNPAERLLKRYAGPCWRYDYQYFTPESKLGCCHACELSVLFGSYITLDGVHDPDAAPVGDRMRKIWGDFAYNTNPGWEEYKASGVNYVIK